MQIKLLPAAESEIADAIDWYETREPGLGADCRMAIEEVISEISHNPLAFPVVEGSNVRRALAKRFPFSIIYLIERESILIIAVFHTSRNPIIWRGRID